jgi:hypothetical protein
MISLESQWSVFHSMHRQKEEVYILSMTILSHEQMMLTKDFHMVKQVGYLGGAREKFVQRMDKLFGAGNWTLGYILNGKPISRDEALNLYQQSYTQFLKANPEFTARMLKNASDVYDTNVSNVASGFDWHHQEDSRSHLQDIAVRRAVRDLGLSFTGTRLMQIRGQDSDLPELNPGRVPFIIPEHVASSRIYVAPWIQVRSVEDFWQNNKFLFVRSSPELLTHLRQEIEKTISAGRASDYKLTSERLAALTICGGGDAELTRKFVRYIGDLQERPEAQKGAPTPAIEFIQDWLRTLLNEQSHNMAPGETETESVLKMVETLLPAIEETEPDFVCISLARGDIRFGPAMICALTNGPFPLSRNLEDLMRLYLDREALGGLASDPICRQALRNSALAKMKPQEIKSKLLDAFFIKNFVSEDKKQLFLRILSTCQLEQ